MNSYVTYNKPIHIAISGFSGCGNTTVSKLVADLMNIKFINYTFRSIAREDGISFDEVCRLADKSDEYDIRVDNNQVRLARESSSVLGSRLAIWVLDEAQLKVFLTASLETRASRIQQREGGNLEEQMQITSERDMKDRARYARIYNIDTLTYTNKADIIVNTDDMGVERVASIIKESALAIIGR